MAVNAIGHYRKCNRASEISALLSSTDVDAQKVPKLKEGIGAAVPVKDVYTRHSSSMIRCHGATRRAISKFHQRSKPVVADA